MPAPKGNKNASGNKGGGRPSSFKPEFIHIAQKCCELGATDRDLAEIFEVCETTINQWKISHIEFSEVLKTGKASADDRVERSLYHKAVGYKHEAVKIFMPAGAAKPVYAPYVEHVPPDTTAAIFWLKNRRADVWRDQRNIEHSGTISLRSLVEASMGVIEHVQDEVIEQASGAIH